MVKETKEPKIVRGTGRSLKEFMKFSRGKTDTVLQIKINSVTRDAQKQEILKEYHKLVTKTDYLNEIAYSFYVEGKNYATIQEESGVRYIQNIVQNEAKRLFEDIGDDPYYIIKYNLLEDDNEYIPLYIARLKELQEEHHYKEVKESAEIFDFDIASIAKMDSSFNATIEDEDFGDLVEMLKMNVIPVKNLVIKEQLDPEYLGYIQYLMTTPENNLTSVDKKRKEHLSMEWMLNE